MFIAYDRLVTPRYVGEETEAETGPIEERHPVIIAGIGRFGQIVNRLLKANDIPTVVLDRDVGQIENMGLVGFKTYYGDVTRPELMHTAGADQARILVVAIDEAEGAIALVELMRREHPHLKILARAYDRSHCYRLREAGADFVGGEELAKKIQEEGWLEFDRVIATPDMMGVVGRLGKVLGPRGLMPNPKVGTVTMDVKNAVREAKAGKVQYKVDKAGVIHCRIGRVSFEPDVLAENAVAIVFAHYAEVGR